MKTTIKIYDGIIEDLETLGMSYVGGMWSVEQMARFTHVRIIGKTWHYNTPTFGVGTVTTFEELRQRLSQK